jgi:hypothetical protein
MPVVLVIAVLGLVAWRYRRFLGLDRLGRDAAPRIDHVRQQLGWGSGGSMSQSRSSGRQSPSLTGAILRRIPPFDASQLPRCLVVGIIVAAVAAALELTGHSILAQIAGLAIGPFVGGIAVRSFWWVFVVAPAVAALIGAGSGLSSMLVAIPVMAVAYGGVRLETLLAPSRTRRRRRPTDQPG